LKITYRQASLDDVTRQFRYYLVNQDAPEVAVRFRDSVRRSVKAISAQPAIAPRFILQNPELKTLRSWPVAGFEAVRLYFLLGNDTMRIIRILHGRRNVRTILERESGRNQ
jgi:plasmid stabilization system protein ParE